ncbi:MAG: polysaccharide biosynthesis C-terminal domain-containing protein [Bacteroidia bacterium]|nr:polysaccharide biosynthesis C-terminal domain-containing protein [Bacteroidia bacterium]MCO5254348.1 oligosaccharide flippase family protein [Bacteroidota bacterium]
MGVVIRQTFKASITNYIGVAFGFLNLVILMPLIFTGEQIGLIKMLTENTDMLVGFSSLGIYSSMYRYFHHFKDDPKGRMHGFDFWAALVPLVGFLVVCLITVVTKGWIIAYFSAKAAEFLEYYLLLLPLVFSQVFSTVFEVTASIEGRIVVPKFIKEVLMRILNAVAFLTYYFGWLSFNQSVWLLVISYFVPLVLIFIYSSSLRKIHLRPDFDFIRQNKPMVKDFFKYTALITIGSISGVLLTKIDMIMISAKMGLGFTGVYVIAFYMSTVIEIPRRSLAQILSGRISEQLKDSNYAAVELIYKKTSTVLYIAAVFLLLCILININNLYKIMPNGDQFNTGSTVIIILAISKAVELLTSMGQIILLYSRYYYVMFLMTIGTMIIGIFLNLWLIPLYGINGAAVATATTIIIQQIIIGVTLYTRLGIHSFTLTQLKTSLLVIAVLGLNYVLPTIDNAWLDASLRTFIAGGMFVWVLYKTKWSEEMNRVINNLIQRVKDRNFKHY